MAGSERQSSRTEELGLRSISNVTGNSIYEKSCSTWCCASCPAEHGGVRRNRTTRTRSASPHRHGRVQTQRGCSKKKKEMHATITSELKERVAGQSSGGGGAALAVRFVTLARIMVFFSLHVHRAFIFIL
ncbi:hypothetical protein NC652_024567 [Populus alba x Populus x berolinensis]|uniref:Uncharacterized protein n=1 Tax=Populus alba x Populus x berolinensis TaxID=444605 RepID=A0AAD6MAQ7_9ROSI|nr:hypothetical protein NC652_024567 [Populus alba x Populus x berolinensis]KAJ6980807.1 hypothetical protein NC653_024233 [Populus alba x Populus x berolinensis]